MRATIGLAGSQKGPVASASPVPFLSSADRTLCQRSPTANQHFHEVERFLIRAAAYRPASLSVRLCVGVGGVAY
eukprot:1157822-Pelagomonas_calceolata.AAC.22